METVSTSSHCRTCNETKENLHSLQELAAEHKTLAEVLLEIAKIDIKNEHAKELSKKICVLCKRQLKNAYAFARQAQRVNEQLLCKLSQRREEDVTPTETSTQLDCLQEIPIDMPSQLDEYTQIKVEMGYNSVVESSSNNTASNSTKSTKETAASYSKSDPIIVAEKHSGVHDENCDSNNSDDEVSYDLQATAFMESKYSDSDEDELPSKRHRGKGPLMQQNAAGRYACNMCNKSFSWQKDLRRHMNAHFVEPQFECEFCEHKFRRKDKLRDHMRVQHKSSNTSSSGGASRLRPPRHPEWSFGERLYSPHSLQLIQCKLCHANFERTHALRQHLQLHRNVSSLLHLQLNSEIIKELCPQLLDLSDIRIQISQDIEQQHYAKYYAVINDYGYELSLSDSDGLDDNAELGLLSVDAAKYECELCHEKFCRKHEIFAHLKSQHVLDQLPYKCNVCKLEFVCEQMFEMHLRTQCRSKLKKYQCLKCPGKFMWLENLEQHSCSNRFYSSEYKAKLPLKRDVHHCNVCDKTFVSLKELKRHLETHDADDCSHECSICLQRFLKQENLLAHKREAHHLERRIQCCLCAATFEHLSQLRTHLKMHADGCSGINMSNAHFFRVFHPQGCVGLEADVANEIASDFLLGNVSRYYSAVDESGNELDLYDSETDDDDCNSNSLIQGDTYKCELCVQTFNRRKRILLHQHSEHGDDDMPYACNECGARYVCLALLEQHRNRDCMNVQKQFCCNRCSARFVWEQNLLQHEQIKHIQPEQQFANKLQCEQCEKVFIWPKDLKRHKRVHLPENEKLECPMCERKFNRKDNMRAHMKSHGVTANVITAIANTTGNREINRSKVPSSMMQDVDTNLCMPHGCKLIQCKICGSKHRKVSDLRTHLRTHQYVVSFTQCAENVNGLSTLLYPEVPPMSEQSLTARIIADISAQRLVRFYSITNEVGYELSIDSSETDSDSESEPEAVDSTRVSERRCYKCELCSAKFERKYKLYGHQASSHKWEDAPYICKHCKTRFVCAELLQRHYEQQCKNMQKRFVCKKCSMRFMWKDNFKMHVLSMHSDADDTRQKPISIGSYDCVHCKRVFETKKDLSRHIIVHRKDAVFKCLWCPRKFYRKDNMLLHVKRHNIPPEYFTMAECIISATNEPNGTKHIYCKVCNLQFWSIGSLRLHLEQSLSTPESPHQNASKSLDCSYSITNKLGFELDMDDSETDDGNGDQSLSKTGTKSQQYTCEICSLTFKRKFEVARHQRSVHKHEYIPIKCDKCIFRTVSKDILAHHMRTQCNNADKQFQCSHCKFKFMWKENLTAHIRLMHKKEEEEEKKNSAEEKIFKCDQCSCKYTRKDRLNDHIKKMHLESSDERAEDNESRGETPKSMKSQIDPATGELYQPVQKRSKTSTAVKKTFLCPFCGRAVTTASNLVVHMRRHTGEKPFKCDFCEMGFPRSSDLQSHRRKHTGERPHVCTICDKSFTRSYKLQTHMRIHSGERPYKCTYCEKSFTQGNDLTLHIRRHTGERPFACGICGERFIQGSALKSHRKLRNHFEEETEPKRTSMLEQF